MHNSILNLIDIQNKIKHKFNELPIIIAVSKNFAQKDIIPLLEHGHLHFGENKVQEGVKKWKDLKKNYQNIKLHMLGKLQSNKVKDCLEVFDYIHSLDSKKLAKKIFDQQIKQNKIIKIFIQVNIGKEEQKSGVKLSEIEELFFYCKSLKLEIIGLMCIPPNVGDPKNYFSEMSLLKNKFNLKNLSMGMSADYMQAIESTSNFVRIGTLIFGNRN